MTVLSRLNSIAARIAAAIILAIFLVVITIIVVDLTINPSVRFVFSKSNVALINPQHHPMMLSGRIVAIIRAVASAPASERPGIVAAMTQPDLEVALDASERPSAAGSENGSLYALHQLIQMQLETLSSPIPISAHRLPSDARRNDSNPEHGVMVAATLQDGQRITFTIPDFLSGAGHGLVIFLVSMVCVSVLVSAWTAHRLAAPIRDFARAAERLGVDLTAAPLAVRGPQELRSTICTVNRMQERLQRFLEDRTQMLAAISHDLRAPLARLRLRAELVTEREGQQKMFEDLDMMNAMIDSTLAFARDDARQEPRRLVDIGILVGDACEDAGDAGGDVSYAGERGIDVPCRPTLMRRAVTNLIDNAVKYGGCARVQIAHDADRVVIFVDDDGPGVPAMEQEKIFAPFYRLDPARNPAIAGVGLGLSIARTIAREHGGDVTVANRDGRGLRATIELPLPER